jgi:hypothetical protein
MHGVPAPDRRGRAFVATTRGGTMADERTIELKQFAA